MDDLISRRAAIDVPSVQIEIKRCEDCVHWDRDGVADEDGDKLCHYYSDGNRSYDFTTQPDDYCCSWERRDG